MSRKPKQALSAPIPRLRFVALIAVLIVWVAIIAARLVWLQVFRHADYAQRELRQQSRSFQIAPRRGVLYDRNLQPLAMTVLVDSVFAVPSEIADKDAASRQLARIVHQDPEDRFTTAHDIDARLHRSRDFAWVARKVDASVAVRVRALGLKGVYFQKEFKRFYPDNQLAAQVLGYVSMDDNGLGGVEHRFDASLHGTPGRVLTAVDARRQSYSSVDREPTPGENLVLTLDDHMQFIAEKALENAIARTHSARGTIVVQDPNTGQILALAIRPTFDPNEIHAIRSSMLRDPAVSDIYEPGSVFKLVTYSAAINEHLTNPDEVVDGQGGKIVVAGRLIHDWHSFGRITVREALEHSSDVCAIKIGLRLGDQRFYDYIRAYGFGQRTGIQLPAETRGLLRPPDRWSASSIGSLAMGQEIGVTPIQAITMISTIANGGEYLPPSIVLERTADFSGNPHLVAAAFHPEDGVSDTLPAGAHRVVTTMTAAEMRSMMESVVLAGTGKFVELNGYSAGGKSGTAQKVDPGTHTYSKTDYIASFGGFAPVNHPAISVLVVLDSPRGGHHGGEVAGPVFGEVVQQILEYLGIPHDIPLKPEKLIAQQRKTAHDEDEGDPQQVGDLTAMFAEINNLPPDDPLRTPPSKAPTAADADEARAYMQTVSDNSSMPPVQPPGTDDASNGNVPAPTGAPPSDTLAQQNRTAPVRDSSSLAAPSSSAVTVGSGAPVTMPGFVGKPMRDVVVTAANLGLNLRIYGSGVASAQAPAAGAHVPAGTTVVVRFQP
ncbi:MAG: penicillin-binding transpeptidase domain-containing protein [Acidobacteriaceae bacterium]